MVKKPALSILKKLNSANRSLKENSKSFSSNSVLLKVLAQVVPKEAKGEKVLIRRVPVGKVLKAALEAKVLAPAVSLVRVAQVLGVLISLKNFPVSPVSFLGANRQKVSGNRPLDFNPQLLRICRITPKVKRAKGLKNLTQGNSEALNLQPGLSEANFKGNPHKVNSSKGNHPLVFLVDNFNKGNSHQWAARKVSFNKDNPHNHKFNKFNLKARRSLYSRLNNGPVALLRRQDLRLRQADLLLRLLEHLPRHQEDLLLRRQGPRRPPLHHPRLPSHILAAIHFQQF